MNLPDLSGLPDRITELPRDARNGLPIPKVNTFGDRHDFTTINAELALLLAQARCCGVCAKPMDEQVAFVGGPDSFDTGTFTDPPMHPGCAEASVTRLCPHITRSHARRASERRTAANPNRPTTAVGWKETKPEQWVIGLTPLYGIELQPAKDNGLVPVYVAHPFTSLRTFGYNAEGDITEQE